MKKILLSTLNAKYIHSSLALRYVKAYCEQHTSLAISLKEFSINEFASDIMGKLYRLQPDILCFSCYIWNISMILEICHDYKQVSPHTIIILGGPEVSYDAVTVLKENPTIDFIVRGEGEVSFQKLLQALVNEESVREIPGITYRWAAEIIQNDDRALIADLDTIPFPYPENLAEFHDKIIYYESSRGCPFQCSYCLSSTQRGVRYFSMARVKQDLSILIAQQVREVKFVDRTFNCNEKRAMEIMRFIIEQGTNSKFHFELDASLLSDEMMDFLKTVPAGIFNFEIGIQSTNPTVLNEVNRQANWQRITQNMQRLHTYQNIHLHLDLIAGLPYEDYHAFARSFNDVYALQPDVLQLGFLKLLKGSAIRASAQKHKYIFQQEAPYQVLANQYLDYTDLLDLQDIEELLEKYHNSGDMQQSIAYIVSSVYDNDAFAFFEEFSDYWNEQEFFAVGHKKDRLYSYLLCFIADHYGQHKDVVNELLKYDYYLRNRSNLLPLHLWSHNPEEVNQKIYSCIKDQQFMQEYLPELTCKSQREIRKNLHLEYLRWDAVHAVMLEQAQPVLFVYDAVKRHAYKIIQLALC